MQEIIDGSPANEMGYASLGPLYLQGKKWDQAEQLYTQMLMNKVNPAAALAGLGDAHAGQGNWPQAAQDYRQAIGRSSDKDFIKELGKKAQAAEKHK